MKRYLYIVGICCIVIFVGCKNKDTSNANLDNNEQMISFSKEITIDEKVLSFFNDYFKDSTLNNIDNYFLIIYQTNDTTLLDINIINNHFSYKTKPIGLIKYKEKNIFIINNKTIFHIREDDNISNLLCENLKLIKKDPHFVGYKHWLFAIDNFTNKYKIIKNEEEIRNVILHWKIIKSPVKFNVSE